MAESIKNFPSLDFFVEAECSFSSPEDFTFMKSTGSLALQKVKYRNRTGMIHETRN